MQALTGGNLQMSGVNAYVVQVQKSSPPERQGSLPIIIGSNVCDSSHKLDKGGASS